MIPAKLLLSRLVGVTKTADGWRARCPAHALRQPSLSISEGSDGRVLLNCHAGCSAESLREKVPGPWWLRLPSNTAKAAKEEELGNLGTVDKTAKF